MVKVVTASTAERMIQAMSSGACAERSEMDSHADTCVAGCNMVVLEDTGQTVSVTPFTSEYNALKGIPIVRDSHCVGGDGVRLSDRWGNIFVDLQRMFILRRSVTCVSPLSQST